ncbi:MAG: hypothetical protein L6R38_008074 [Xanthoria sp. 2 TBL-2021]|nr:MAG: hypothetical protein L6R38_008074 [Xanthoria sp. 2 TBL-2021]
MSRTLSMQEKHPELYAQHTYVEPAKRKRTVKMEVLCLSYMRTGTASMYAALNMVGLPCFHSFSLYSRIQDCSTWSAALDAKFFNRGPKFTKTEWDQLLSEYAAITDVPATAFAEELVSAYPDAKVILMERDIDSWFTSFDNAIIKPIWNWTTQFIGSVDPWYVGPLKDLHMRWVRGWMESHSEDEMRRKAKPHYREHNALVRRITPNEKLLEYKMGSGWEPLCRFLGKPIPDVDFPRVNETAALQEKISIILQRGAFNFLKRIMLVVGPLLLAGLWAAKYR